MNSKCGNVFLVYICLKNNAGEVWSSDCLFCVDCATTTLYITVFLLQIIRDDLVNDLKHQLKVSPDLTTAVDNAGNTPIHIASKYNRVRSLAILLQGNAGMYVCN